MSPASAPARRAHLIGIGGNGMSSLAGLLVETGWRVTGSDIAPPDRGLWPGLMQHLITAGCQIEAGHRPEHVPPDADLVVYSAAIRDDNVELQHARRLGIRIQIRGAALGDLMRGRTGVAVAGSNGKTTTTAMLGTILTALGHSPMVYVGSPVTDWDGRSYLIGSGPACVAETDESDGAYLLLPYTLAVVTQIHHLDHPDVFRDEQAAMEAFAGLTERADRVIVNGDSPMTRALRATHGRRPITFGLEEACTWQASITEAGPAGTAFELRAEGRMVGRGRLKVPGRHNLMNALAAVAGSVELGADPRAAMEALADFRGARRRLERLDDVSGRIVYDDCGHNWVQINAAIEALRQRHPTGRLVCLFSPFSRRGTNAGYDAFERAFPTAHAVGIMRRDAPADHAGPGHVPLTYRGLAERLVRHGHRSVPLENVVEAANWALAETGPGDIVLVLGTTVLAREALGALGAYRDDDGVLPT